MKIFDAGQIRKWDAATMADENISHTALMQRAGNVCARWIKKKFPRPVAFCIVCGKGGNAGDGLVIARDLLHAGYSVSLILSEPAIAFTGATLDHWNNLKEEFPPFVQSVTLAGEAPGMLSALNKTEQLIIIDALLGTGYRPGPGNDIINGLIEAINEMHCPVIAIDLPSGLSPDSLPAGPGPDERQDIIRASITLTFQAWKRSFLHPESAPYTGRIRVLDIGLSPAFSNRENTAVYTTDLGDARKIYRPRPGNGFGHKGNFGTAVLAGGSYGKIGAIALSATAALRAGAGKVFIQAPKCGYEILQTGVPEAMFDPAGESYVSEINRIPKATYGLGPGMDTHPESINALKAFLAEQKSPLVLDADALNIIATAPGELLREVPRSSIITPHPGEFRRLFGDSKDSMAQVEKARAEAHRLHIVIVLKGHRTAVCTPDGSLYYNLSGNAGMATAGSGDVLTGIITALLAHGYRPDQAALLGVYLHGLAGDCCIKNNAPESLIARDLIDYLPQAFRKLQKTKRPG